MPNTSPPHGIFEHATSTTLGFTQGLLLAGAIVLGLAFVLIAFYLWRRKRGKRREVPSDPWVLLRTQLQPKLEQSAIERMQVLNYTLRKSLELRTKSPYTAWTSQEILDHLQTKLEFSSDFQAQCGEFLLTADRVLFAHEPWDRESRDRFERLISAWLDKIQGGHPL